MKKKLGYLLSLTIVASMLTPVVSAQAAKTPIDVFDDFSGFSSVDGNDWIDPHGQQHENISSYKAEGSSAMLIGPRTNYNYSWDPNQKVARKFYGNFNKGSLHISFDTKLIPDTTFGDNIGLDLHLFGSASRSDAIEQFDAGISSAGMKGFLEEQYDYLTFKNTDNADPAQSYKKILTISDGAEHKLSTYTNVWAIAGSAVESETTFTKEEWHKFDVVVEMGADKNNRKYTVYMDGTKVGEGTLSANIDTDNFIGVAFTSISAKKGAGKGNGGYIIDNLYAESFDSVDSITGPEIKLNDNKGIIRDNTLKLIFTEALTTAPVAGNFTITSDNGALTGFTVTKSSKMGAEINLGDNAGSGRYTVALTDVTGAITAKTVKSENFSVEGKGSNAATTPFYLMNEDFNNYTGDVHGTYEKVHNRNTNKYGDIPVGWYDGDIDITTTFISGTSVPSDYNQVQSKYGAFWQRNGYMMNATAEHFVTPFKRTEEDYAMKLGAASCCSWAESVRYYFPSGVASGDFVMEFDVMHKGGGWNIGTVGYQSWDSIYAFQSGHSTGNTAQQLASGANQAIMNWSDLKILGVNATSTDLMVSELISNRIDDGNLVTKAGTIPEEKWTNVKVEFNTNTGIYDVTITPEGESVQTYQWKDNGRGRFEKGIKGITVNRIGGADKTENYVCVDNFKVYKTDSYLVNDDFDDYDDAYETDTNGSMMAYMPGGWYTENHQQVTRYETYKGNNSDMYYMKRYNSVKAGRDENDEYNSTTRMDMTGGGIGRAVFKAFSRPVGQGVPFAVSFDIKAENDNTWWKLLLPNQAHLNLLTGFNYTGTLADGTTKANHNNNTWDTVQGKCVVLSQYAGAKNPTAHSSSVLMQNKMSNAGHETELTSVATTSGAWFNYILSVVPRSDGHADVTVTVTNNATQGVYTAKYELWDYQENTNWYMWPAAGIGFIAGGGTVSIDNVKVCEGTVKVVEDSILETEVATIEETNVNTASIISIRAEYMNGESEELTDGDIIRPSTKRIAIEFNDAVAVAEAKDVMQPYNPIKTSRKILDKGLPEGKALSNVMNYGGTANGTPLKAGYETTYADCVERFKVYDTIEDMITFRRLGITSDAEVEATMNLNKYLSEDKKTYYIDVTEGMLTDGVDYVLDIAENISFASSIYSKLNKGVTLKLGTQGSNSFDVYELGLMRKAGQVWVDVESAADMLKFAENNTEVKMIVKGYNETTDDIDIFTAFAQYGKSAENEATDLNNPYAQVKKVGAGKGASFEIPVTVDIEKSADLFKGFVWTWTDMKPVTDNIEIN